MYIILTIIIFLIAVTFLYSGLSAAPFVPTHKKDIEAILKLADIKPGQKVYDLGCGDGRIISALALQRADAEGFEVSLLPYILSQFRIFFLKRKNKNLKIKIKFADFWNRDLSDADIVYVFLTKRIYPKLKNKLEKELKKGTKIICYAWAVNGWHPVSINKREGYMPIYLYKI